MQIYDTTTYLNVTLFVDFCQNKIYIYMNLQKINKNGDMVSKRPIGKKKCMGGLFD